MDYSLTKKAAEEQITAKLSHFFGVTPEEANYEQFYKAIAMITRDMLRQGRHEFEKRCEERILSLHGVPHGALAQEHAL